MKLTSDNYYSQEANKVFLSVSQYKAFAGSLGKPGCEYEALQDLNGNAVKGEKSALLLGSYVDAAFEGTLDDYIECHKSTISKKSGEKYAEYVKADEAIEKARSDPFFMKYMAGDKQTIMQGNIGGAEWKIKTDSYLKDKAIVDLKYMQSIREPKWSDIAHMKLDFIRFYGYDIQGAVYQEVVYQNTGKRLPFYIAAITKESPCDMAVIQVTQNYLDDAMERVKSSLPRVVVVKNGQVEPVGCGVCPTCRRDKKLTAPISIDDLMGQAEAFN